MRAALRVAAATACVLWGASILWSCADGDVPGLACPLLAPGALAASGPSGGIDQGAPIQWQQAAVISGELARGGLVAHPLWLPQDTIISVALSPNDSQQTAVIMVYGPRDQAGGYPHCSQLLGATGSVRARLQAFEGGEYLVIVGGRPADQAHGYALHVECEAGCGDGPPCPTLAEQGCGAMRCDGVLATDPMGCATCHCDADTLCSAERRAGPGGSCVLPACTCDDQPDAPVCGSDGRTWRNGCEALCAGVTIARPAPCAIDCPALAGCDTESGGAGACFGLRTLDAQGCPTCECLPAFAPDAASCGACSAEVAPACGSDGVTYPNRCVARCSGARLLYAAACVDSCRVAPDGCDLDCPWGLAWGAPLSGGGDGGGGDDSDQGRCLRCQCAAGPSVGCEPSGAPVCARFEALGDDAPTTVGSPCLAARLGATRGDWGPCGVLCAGDEDCPEDASRCVVDGSLAGRCAATGEAFGAASPDISDANTTISGCGCSAIYDPVCDGAGVTWPNKCEAACAGEAAALIGPCCEAMAPCGVGEVTVLDSRGCPGGCAESGPTLACAANAATGTACDALGVPLSPPAVACDAHVEGVAASIRWCSP